MVVVSTKDSRKSETLIVVSSKDLFRSDHLGFSPARRSVTQIFGQGSPRRAL